MKAVLMGLALGAATCLAANVGNMAASREARTAQPVLYQPVPTAGEDSYTQISSASVLAPQRIAWNHDGSALYVQGLESIIRLDAANGATAPLMDVPANEMVLDISSGGIVAVMRDFQSVLLRGPDAGVETTLLAGVNVSSASFSPDGSVLAVVLDDGSMLQTWDVASGQVTGTYESSALAEKAYSVTFAPSGERLTWYSVMGGQTLDLASGELGLFVAFSAAIYDVQMCSNEALVVANDGATLTLWDTSNASIVHRVDDLQVYSNSCTPEGGPLAVTTESHVGLLRLPSLSTIEMIPIEAVDAELSADGNRLAIVGADGTIGIWQRA